MIERPPGSALGTKQVVKKGDIKPGVVAHEKDIPALGYAMMEINDLGDSLLRSDEATLLPAFYRESVDGNCTWLSAGWIESGWSAMGRCSMPTWPERCWERRSGWTPSALGAPIWWALPRTHSVDSMGVSRTPSTRCAPCTCESTMGVAPRPPLGRRNP